MQVDLGIWNKLTWAVTVLGLLVGVGLVAGSYVPLFKQRERMMAQIEKLDRLIDIEQKNATSLSNSIDAYLHDPRTVERLARESLHYAKPGETVIRYIGPDTNGILGN